MTMIGPPTITPENASPDTLTLWGYLPQFVQDTDANNQYTFLSWLEGICSQLQVLDDLCRDTEEGIGWSILMNVGRCPNWALPWLAQFVGVNIPGNIQGTSPAQDSAMRMAILAENSFARGSLAGITASILSILGPDGAVNIIERYPDPYSLTIQYTDTDGALTYGVLASEYPWYTSAGGTPDVTDAFPFYDDFPTTSGFTNIAAQIQQLIPGGLVAAVVDVT